jgi:hypothetical protein
MMKSMAAFKHLAVADVASIGFCSRNGNGIGSAIATADNQFRGDKPIELVSHSSYGDGADVTMQMMLFRTRRARKADSFVSPHGLRRDLFEILPI